MTFGLSSSHQEILCTIFERHLPAGQVLVYGSRAKGNFNARSDIDLVIKQAKNTDRHLLATIQDAIEESDFPYLSDIQFFETIKNPQLIEHIDRVAKLLYEKTE